LYSVAHYYSLSRRCVTHAHSPVHIDHDSLWIRAIQRETQWVHLLKVSQEKYTAAGYPNTQLQATQIHSCRLPKYTAAGYPNTQLQATQIHSCRLPKYTVAGYPNTQLQATQIFYTEILTTGGRTSDLRTSEVGAISLSLPKFGHHSTDPTKAPSFEEQNSCT